LYAYVRCQGYDIDDARDLTQAYFTRLLEKDYLNQVEPKAGRFRSFLLTTLKHFLVNEWNKARASKRGGHRTFISLDTEAAEERYLIEPVDDLTPEKLFERRWTLTVIERVLDRLNTEFSRAGKSQHFELLSPYLTGGEPQASYKQTADKLGVDEKAIKVWVHRLRRRFGKLLREEIAQTVANEDQIEIEIKHLLSGVTESAVGVIAT
jgi:RNA polymerase sigma-70 factor (ECF subfamily)